MRRDLMTAVTLTAMSPRPVRSRSSPPTLRHLVRGATPRCSLLLIPTRWPSLFRGTHWTFTWRVFLPRLWSPPCSILRALQSSSQARLAVSLRMPSASARPHPPRCRLPQSTTSWWNSKDGHSSGRSSPIILFPLRLACRANLRFRMQPRIALAHPYPGACRLRARLLPPRAPRDHTLRRLSTRSTKGRLRNSSTSSLHLRLRIIRPSRLRSLCSRRPVGRLWNTSSAPAPPPLRLQPPYPSFLLTSPAVRRVTAMGRPQCMPFTHPRLPRRRLPRGRYSHGGKRLTPFPCPRARPPRWASHLTDPISQASRGACARCRTPLGSHSRSLFAPRTCTFYPSLIRPFFRNGHRCVSPDAPRNAACPCVCIAHGRAPRFSHLRAPS
ncbi:hypothetical protein FKP32DRAFT_692054 [Trametes sanguinea]|nr:hypothetical protein FKP32DRAFT_692054 [Trametes sanguinea]